MERRQNTFFWVTGCLVFIFALLFLGLPLSALGYDTRLLALDSPTLSQTAGAAAAGVGVNIIFPSDEFGLGLSSVPDTFDIWKLPGRLADKRLFPSNSVILNYTGGTTGNGGIVIAPAKLPFALGVFVLRPNLNGWVIGSPRGDLAGLGASYYADAVTDGILSVPALGPAAPTNVIDGLIAVKLGRFTIGAGVGYAYDKALDTVTSTEGTANSEITQKSESSVITVRFGAGVDFTLGIPFALDLGQIVAINNYEASYKSGAVAAPPSEDDVINGDSMATSVYARVLGSVSPALDIVLLVDYAWMEQEYDQVDNGTTLDSTTAQVDKDGSNFGSVGFGAGMNWTPSNKVLVNALVTAVLGEARWIAEAPGPTFRQEDFLTWKTFRGVIGGEFTLAPWIVLRGGIGSALSWSVTELNADTGGTSSEAKSFNFTTTASAGMGIKIKDPVTLDFVVNMSNFTSSTFFQTLALQTSMKVDF